MTTQITAEERAQLRLLDALEVAESRAEKAEAAVARLRAQLFDTSCWGLTLKEVERMRAYGRVDELAVNYNILARGVRALSSPATKRGAK